MFLSRWLISLIALLGLDGCWIYFFMGTFFKSQVGHLMRADLQWTGVLACYFVMHACLYYFVIRDRGVQKSADAYIASAIMGLGLFGVYELTNYATIQGWPLKLVIVDTTWGTLLCMAVVGITRMLHTGARA